MKKVLITGSKGVVGKILTKGLNKFYYLFSVDLPEFDVRSYETIVKLSKGKDSIIHLAWNTKRENGNAIKEDPDNTTMCKNIYSAALENKVPRVIISSSVHATNYESLIKQGIVSVKEELDSLKVYGRHKRFLEKEGKKYASRGLEVICVRLGGICGEHEKPWMGLKRDGLAYPDLINLFKACIDADVVLDNYSLIYGVSKNGESLFDLSNHFNWKPQFNAIEFYNLFD